MDGPSIVPTTDMSPGKGAWGLRLTGCEISASLLVDAPPHWPALEIILRASGDGADELPPPAPGELTLALFDSGEMRLSSDQRQVTLTFPTIPSSDALVHPYLASTVAMVNWWLGRETFHAGVVIVNNVAWALLGDREAGKSSALAWFEANDVVVVTDDVLAVAGDQALAGPRCIDLRPEASGHFAAGRDIGVIGYRERRRVDLGPCPAEVLLGGWVLLDWGDECEVQQVDGTTVVRRLLGSLGVNLAPDPERILHLASLPARRFCRPRSWVTLDESMQRLTDELTALSAARLREFREGHSVLR
jgi:hypothetical protein